MTAISTPSAFCQQQKPKSIIVVLLNTCEGSLTTFRRKPGNVYRIGKKPSVRTRSPIAPVVNVRASHCKLEFHGIGYDGAVHARNG